MSKTPFCYGQPCLENDLVILEPFEPSMHVTYFVEAITANNDIFDYIPFPDVKTDDDFVTKVWNKDFVPSAAVCLYAVIDKVMDKKFAGVISIFGTDQTTASTEIGVMIFPEFQGTHVARNAVGLVVMWLMDPPSAGGLGLRRLEWQTHPQNEKSRKFAVRMGLEFEGVLRWKKVFTGGKVSLSTEALRVRNGTKEEAPGRHTAIYSVVWDEWEEKRSKIVAQMQLKGAR